MEIDLIVKHTALIENSNNNIVEISEVVKTDPNFSKENIKENNMIVEKMMIMTWILH